MPVDSGKSKTQRADYQRRGKACSGPFRGRVKAAFQSTCEYCGTIEPADVASKYSNDGSAANAARFHTVDRVVSGTSGGLYLPDNVTLACRSCNSRKRNRDGLFIGPVRTLSMLEAVS
jgi:5-methylcytosine-specific restriction endonuclease McrA